MRRGTALVLAGMVLILAGCSSPGVDGSAGSSAVLESVTSVAAADPAAGSSSVTADSPSIDGDILVEFGQQGGIRGVSDHLTVLQDGAVTVTRARPASSRTGQLSAAELSDLRRQLDALNSTPLPRADPVTGNDLYSYQVIYREQKILAEQGAVPPDLEPVIATLAGIVAAYGS